ncbi:MAG: hypothetical protein IM568_08440 [Flavobacterium sp.]|nr:hypothetical protein [Flavobacterium sp.]
MAEAVILANGKAIRKNYFDVDSTFEYHNNGFVKGFWKNGTYYIALYNNGELKSFAFYCKRAEYYKIVKEYDNNKVDRPKGILVPHKFDEAYFLNNYATLGQDKVVVQVRGLNSNQLCLFLKRFTHFQDKYDITSLLVGTDEEIIDQDCNPLEQESQLIYNSAINRDSSYPQWDMQVVADIAEIISSMESDVKSVLQAQGMLPIYQQNIEYWTSDDNSDSYYLYSNTMLIRYRDYLIKYKAWFLSIKGYLNDLSPNDNERLYSVIGHMSASALQALDVDKKISILDIFCTNSIMGYYLSKGEFNEEHIVLKVVRSVTDLQANEFLTKLSLPGRYASVGGNGETLFEKLYEKIGDEWVIGLDDQNRFALMHRLFLLWYLSDYNPYEKYNLNSNTSDTDELYDSLKDKIITLPYESNKTWGFYVDNMDFLFSKGKIEVEFDYGNWLTSPLKAIIDLLLDSNKYSFYQAVTFKYTGNEYAVQIPSIALVDKIPGTSNTINVEVVNLPLFYLKYMDDYGDNEDLWTGIALAFDIVLTFTGIGNLAKLRHLRHVTKLGRIAIGKTVPAAERILATQALRGITGALELTSSIASLILNYYSNGCQIYINNVNSNFNETNSNIEIPPQTDNPDYNWCRNLDRWLMAVQLLSGGVDLVSQRILSKSSKKLIDDGVPLNFPDEALTVIASYTDEGELFLTAFRAKRRLHITSDINNKMWRANLDKFGNIKNPKDFELIYNNNQIEELIQYSTNKNLDIDEIVGFIFISGRRNKNIEFNELKNQIDNWYNIKNNLKYPYKFNNLAEYNTFKNKVKQQLEHWDIPSGDVRIQGSSLRTPNAKDLDVAIMISESQLQNLRNKIIERYRRSFTKANGKLVKDKFDEAVSNLDEQIAKGYIKNRQFGLLEGQKESFMTELYDIRNTYPQGNSLDISIIIKERNFNTPPYLIF